ncbi:hypothetical protein AQUCO_03700146v1 [Aquilegia coerulea]|uniref:Retrotransposon Copia-like N-terminal domain-containing protein n=1 Tax=Aquilegia coerulea TaxID=218851 RepID=A0A2G5CTR7_AQUCA|nr:hypothetical protein AQUCO_03700146v1 [Aquilegia coerulea]
MNQDLVRLERFDGENFTKWQEKVMFFLTAFKLAYILDDNLTPIPDEKPDDTEALKKQRQKRKEDEFLCRGHILNALSGSVYTSHRLICPAKALWTALQNKYRIEEASNQKFLVGNYIEFKMTDDKSILSQVHELQNVVSDLKTASIDLPEDFLVGVIIAKLPNSWNGYKNKTQT